MLSNQYQSTSHTLQESFSSWTYLGVDDELLDLVDCLLEGGSLAGLDQLLLELLVRLDVVVLDPGTVGKQ